MNFKSDNESPAHPLVIQALLAANEGMATAYADDDWSNQLNAAFSERFETDCSVLPIATGTAANSVSLAAVCPPWGGVLCHQAAHIHNDEGGAPEFYTDGAKLIPLPGSHGKLNPQRLAAAIEGAGVHGVHNVKPSVVSITQATECGTTYSVDEVRAIASVCQRYQLPLQMDGARFANAVVHLGCTPADITWKAGVDMLSFGATKNGAVTAEAIVVFGRPEWLEAMDRRRKRGGHLLSKMRYVSAQLLAMLDQDLWLQLADQANLRAAELAQGIEQCDGVSLQWPVQANEVFMQASPERFESLLASGASFHLWPGHDNLARLVCSWCTSEDDVQSMIALLDATESKV
ncbi:MAG: low specificity L-threonine aldolase [Pseudomonadota bacterium]